MKDILENDPADVTRRAFCGDAGRVVTLLAAAGLVPACGGGGSSSGAPSGNTNVLPTVGGAQANGQVTVTVDGASPLATIGNAASLASPAILLVRTGADAITALTAICTHEACVVNRFSSQRFECPCHGSQYSTSGAVLRGPAPSALRTFPTTFANGVLTITL